MSKSSGAQIVKHLNTDLTAHDISVDVVLQVIQNAKLCVNTENEVDIDKEWTINTVHQDIQTR